MLPATLTNIDFMSVKSKFISVIYLYDVVRDNAEYRRVCALGLITLPLRGTEYKYINNNRSLELRINRSMSADYEAWICIDDDDCKIGFPEKKNVVV